MWIRAYNDTLVNLEAVEAMGISKSECMGKFVVWVRTTSGSVYNIVLCSTKELAEDELRKIQLYGGRHARTIVAGNGRKA